MKLVFVLVPLVLLAELFLPQIIAKYFPPKNHMVPPAQPYTERDIRLMRKDSQYRKERRAAEAQQRRVLH